MAQQWKRLSECIEKSGMTIETQEKPFLSDFPTPYTLHLKGKHLRSETRATHTITCEDAMVGLLASADMQCLSGSNESTEKLREIGSKTERTLKRFMGTRLFTEFWEALLQDEAEQRSHYKTRL